MGAYHQMGHQSQNLFFIPELSSFAGVVLSPVNADEAELSELVGKIRYRRGSDIVFDPQLYVPKSGQQRLREWSYFPKDVDTADLASQEWWDGAVDQILAVTARLKTDAVCSPAALPKAFTDDYFSHLVHVGSTLAHRTQGTPMRALQSATVGLSDLATPGRALTIASILSATECQELYLVLVGPETNPRRELSDPDELTGAMRLIAALQQSGLAVMVAFASSDLLLWKASGASHCATGKFFNLRRFTRSRFDEPPPGGGGALPYWFEESLLAFLRESDLVRVRRGISLSDSSNRNPFAKEISAQHESKPDEAWIALGWKQYLWWFADFEARVDARLEDIPAMLKAAEASWAQLETAEPQVLMDEPFNNGAWIRQWRRALAEYPYPEPPT